jgi:hypothetical protein
MDKKNKEEQHDLLEEATQEDISYWENQIHD